MIIEPGSVAGVELIGAGAAEFLPGLRSLLGREPEDPLTAALPYSVIARNVSGRVIALLGVRFDMLGAQGKSYSVVHYADTLRFPERADLIPGAMRFVCAEPLYSRFVLHRETSVDERARMNLANLRKVLRIKASVDCVAFDDGLFSGADSLGAFERFERERAAESQFVEEVLNAGSQLEAVLTRSLDVPGLRTLARRLHAYLGDAGAEEAVALAGNHRCRIRLYRS